MKNKKEMLSGLVESFLWSIFVGVVGISIGLGALYPPLNYIAKPFVCPAGEMTFEKQVDSPTPDRTFYSADWYCTNSASNSERLPVNPAWSAGVIYGVLCFPLVLLGRSYFKKKEEELEQKDSKWQNSGGFPRSKK